MTLYFVTSSRNKFAEAKEIIPRLEQLELDLPEIQSLDSHEIIRQKLTEAAKHHKGTFVVEDVSLSLECLNGLPGPLIKWFLKTIGIEGIARLAEKLGNNKAVAKCVIGYSDGKATRFFEGSVRGKIVSPRKKSSFGWDPIFQPDCYRKTFEDMTKEEKNKISHRGIAFSRLEKFLKKN